MPSTRTTVAVLALVAVAGCLGSPSATTGTPTAEPTSTTAAPTPTGPTTGTPATTATPTTPASGTTRTTRDCYHEGFEVEASPTSPAQVAHDVATRVADLSHDSRELASDALANGSATTTVLGSITPLEDGDLIEHDGSFYRVERTTVEVEGVTADEFDLEGPLHEEYDAEAYAAAEESAVPFEELSAPDRRVFREGTPAGERLDHLVDGEGRLRANYRYAFRNDSVRDASTLVEDGPHYVSFRGAYWRVAPTGDRSSTRRVTYRYRLNRSADSAEAFGETLVERYAVGLNDSFDGAERDLLVRAVAGERVSWSGCEGEAPAGYEALSDALRDVPASPRHAYVTYRGSLYRVTVSHAIE